MFSQWTRRTGAPALVLDRVRVLPLEVGFQVQARLRQAQSAPVYDLDVPVLVQTSEGFEEISRRFDTQAVEFSIERHATPLRLMVDPRFDVFRRLDLSELPASLDEILSRPGALAVIPGVSDQQRRLAYRHLAFKLGATTIVDDYDIDALPMDEVVWVFGWENGLLPKVRDLLKPRGASLTDELAIIGSQVLGREEQCVTSVMRRTTMALPIAFIGCDSLKVTNSLGSRLLHYGKYSYLGFDVGTGRNVVKGNWTVSESGLNVMLADGLELVPFEMPKAIPLSAYPLPPSRKS